MPEQRLLPCPFCGEHPNYVDYTGKNNTDNPKHFIECDCGATMNGFTKEQAIEAWNERSGHE